VGKAVCEHLCFSGGSHTSDTGPVLNPHDHTRSAAAPPAAAPRSSRPGRSRWRSAGTRAGPSACPAPGAASTGSSDLWAGPVHRGLPHRADPRPHRPHCRQRLRRGLLLEAIAGEDGVDPRQRDVRVGDYRGSLDGDAQGLRIGIVTEGFGWPGLSERTWTRRCGGQPGSSGTGGGGERGLRAHAPRRHPHLERDRRRGRDGADGARQLDGHQLEGPLLHLVARRLRPGARHPRRRPLRDRQARDADGRVHARELPRTLLRQGPEPRRKLTAAYDPPWSRWTCL
jgi:hypothetical protein